MNLKKILKSVFSFILDNFSSIVTSAILTSPLLFFINAIETFLSAHMHITLTFIGFLLLSFFFTIQFAYKVNKRIYKFSVLWDYKARPHCVICDSILIYKEIPQTEPRHASLNFYCLKCDKYIFPYESTSLFDALKAVQIMKERLGIPLDIIPFQPLHK